jgi:hypothetical protein
MGPIERGNATAANAKKHVGEKVAVGGKGFKERLRALFLFLALSFRPIY